jgi:hypothetical protein
VIRVVLPYHLRNLAKVGQEVQVDVSGVVTANSILDAVEEAYPMLRGLIREHETGKRRRLLRFFTCGEDVSFAPMDQPLPPAVAEGSEPFMVIGAIAGG